MRIDRATFNAIHKIKQRFNNITATEIGYMLRGSTDITLYPYDIKQALEHETYNDYQDAVGKTNKTTGENAKDFIDEEYELVEFNIDKDEKEKDKYAKDIMKMIENQTMIIKSLKEANDYLRILMKDVVQLAHKNTVSVERFMTGVGKALDKITNNIEPLNKNVNAMYEGTGPMMISIIKLLEIFLRGVEEVPGKEGTDDGL